MKYHLKKPCKTCPFVVSNDFYLRPGRVEEIRDNRGEFPCHNTVDYEAATDSETGEMASWRDTSEEQHCFGHLVLQWHEWGGFNQLQALAASMGWFNPEELPTAEEAGVYDSWDEMVTRMEEW